VVAAVLMAAAGLFSAVPAAAFVTVAHPVGPTPTTGVLEADAGPFSTQAFVPNTSPGFGGGTIYFPIDTTEGPLAAIAISPGYTGTQSSIDWLGPRLASHGFVVITIDTNSLFNFPSSRADQLGAALDLVAAESNDGSSPITNLVDPERRGVIGHSMGGGGALIAAANDPTIDVAIPLAPWNTGTDFAAVDVPVLVVACENDLTAPTAIHSEPMYESITGEKAYLELNGGSHSCANSGNGDRDLLGKYMVSWLKRWLDQDLRYGPYLCGPLHEADLVGPDISDYRDTCAYDLPVLATPSGAVVNEGPFGFQTACVPVVLDRPAEYPVTVDWATLDNSAPGVATAGADYIAAEGTVTIGVGESTGCADITLVGDAIDEPPLLYGEWLLVVFSNPSVNTSIDPSFFGLGLVIILDDD